MANRSGTRLAYVVVKLEGKVEREVSTWSKAKGLERKLVKQDAGYLVYFPRGHVLRMRDEAQLRHYNLDGDPPIINMQGLTDPRSPMGKLFLAQDDASRTKAMDTLEQQVIALATAKTGPIVMPEQNKNYRAEPASA